ncbi:MAG: peptidoglycan DD-metalloendopeptidase family protein [Chloroflexota bacterium]
MRILRPLFAAFALLLACTVSSTQTSAQSQCGVANSVSFPVDTTQFRLVQDFGAPSPRHQGRYHTGEDWYGGRGSYGTEVHAIADGRVTFSSPNGWGRDGGVIIIEHNFPDGTTAYSMYGHVTDATGIGFPAPFTCVREGDVIAAVGDPRPAPHLHFEIRTDKPDIPGPGYTWQDPATDGWRRPSKFVDNWQAWFLETTRWHTDIADEAGPIAPPVELGDHSLIVLDANRVLRVSSDGRVLWRVILDQPAVGLIAQPNNTLIAYADGTIQPISSDGALGSARQIGIAPDSAPMQVGDSLLFHQQGGGLSAFSPDAVVTRWHVSDVPPILRWVSDGRALGLMTSDNAMLTVSAAGEIVDRALLREPGSLTAGDNGLLAYTRGGLWRVASDGTWSLDFADAPPGGRNSAVAEDAQQLFLFDGASLYAYDRAHTQQWVTALPGVAGVISLSVYDGVVLLTSSHGSIIALQASSGGVCNATRIYGSSRSREWHSLGDDGILRVYVADQIIGLEWLDFLMACHPA